MGFEISLGIHELTNKQTHSIKYVLPSGFVNVCLNCEVSPSLYIPAELLETVCDCDGIGTFLVYVYSAHFYIEDIH